MSVCTCVSDELWNCSKCCVGESQKWHTYCREAQELDAGLPFMPLQMGGPAGGVVGGGRGRGGPYRGRLEGSVTNRRASRAPDWPVTTGCV